MWWRKKRMSFLRYFNCVPPPIDKTIQKIYKIKISFLCTLTDTEMKKYFYKTKISFLCTPIDIV